MPRKYYTLKNPYCRNAKISGRQFELILLGWCKGATATDTASALNRINEKTSRQTVQNFFTKIGKRVWESRYLPRYEQYITDSDALEQARESAQAIGLQLSDEELKNRMLKPIFLQQRLNVYAKLDYKKFRQTWDASPDSEKPYALLRDLSKKMNGISKNCFEYHLSRTLLINTKNTSSNTNTMSDLLAEFRLKPL